MVGKGLVGCAVGQDGVIRSKEDNCVSGVPKPSRPSRDVIVMS